MSLRLTLSIVFLVSIGPAVNTFAEAPPTQATKTSIGSIPIAYPTSRSGHDDDWRAVNDKVSAEEMIEWLKLLGDTPMFGASEDLVPVIDPHSDEWNSLDTSNTYYNPAWDKPLDEQFEQEVDDAVDAANEIIAILIGLLGVSVDEAEAILDDLLQTFSLSELEEMFAEVDNATDLQALLMFLYGEAIAAQADDADYYRSLGKS